MIQAIPTSYDGHKFRSRLEARWALFFNLIGIPWEYEREAFSLVVNDKPTGYTPDFWLPAQQTWFEVKPEAGSFDEDGLTLILKKSFAFARQSQSLHVAFGAPRDGWIWRCEVDRPNDEDCLVSWARCAKCHRFVLNNDDLQKVLPCGHWDGRVGHRMTEGALSDATAHRFWEPKVSNGDYIRAGADD